MNERRMFLKRSVLAAGGLAFFKSTNALAASGGFPAGIIYTKENPGKWVKKIKGHVPVVKVDGTEVTITTNHDMFKMHYIVRHTLVTAGGKVIGEKTFYPTDPEPLSTFDLPTGAGSKFYATSFCNLHDFWMTEFSI